MRSTMTSTREGTLHWERVGGAHAGEEALYGDYAFRAHRWQPGSYTASVTHRPTGTSIHYSGGTAREIRTLSAAKARCEKVYQELQEADRAAGITRS